MIRISEIYESKQGEGLLTGTPSVFIRLSGCNLRCSFCDTPFASWNPEGQKLSVESILERVLDLTAENVVITGGEPLIFEQVGALCRAIKENSKHITIETAGTVAKNLQCDLMSISPKMSNSTPDLERAKSWRAKHEATRHRPGIVQQLVDKYTYQIKFVIDTENDLQEVESYLNLINGWSPSKILMMPQGTTTDSLDRIGPWLSEYCYRKGFIFSDRMHIRWYGNRRGT